MKCGFSLETTVKYLNEFLYQNTTAEHFISCFIGVLDINEKTLKSINAGHNYPFLFQSDGSYKTLKKGGMGLGISEEETFQVETNQFSKGDVLFLYTDGLTEAENTKNKFYENSRLKRVIKSNIVQSSKNILHAVYEDNQNFVSKAAMGSPGSRPGFLAPRLPELSPDDTPPAMGTKPSARSHGVK